MLPDSHKQYLQLVLI